MSAKRNIDIRKRVKKISTRRTVDRKTYKRREILIKRENNRSELYVDGERIVTIRDRSGGYFAARFAYTLQPSLLDVAKRLIDYGSALERRRTRGREKKPGMPQRG